MIDSNRWKVLEWIERNRSMDFYDAWEYLNENGIFKDIYGEEHFHDCLKVLLLVITDWKIQ